MGEILNNKRFFPNFSQLMITYPFGGSHYGIDLVAFDGKSTRVDKIMAHDGGTVSLVAFDTYAGYIVEITVDDIYVERYQHLAKDSITVKIGDKVKTGQVIAYMGNTGIASQGAHLHFAIRENGKYIDPKPYLDKDVKKATPTNTNDLINSTIANRFKVLQSGHQVGAYTYYSYAMECAKKCNGIIWDSIQNKQVYPEEAKPVVSTPKPTTTQTTNTKSLKAGTKYELKGITSYQSPDTKVSSGPRTGTYYIWSEQVDMGRIRMTNRPDRVGVKGQVSFFVNVADLK